MNKILVVAKNPKTYFIKRLISEVGEASVLLFNPWVDALPCGYDSIIVRTSGVYHSEKDLEFLRTCSISPLNSLKSHIIFRSKASQYNFFNQHDHPTLPWWRLEDWETTEQGCFLVKPDFGQGGWGIRVFDRAGLKLWREEQRKLNDLSWIVQPYLKASEYRIFFMGSERITLERLPDLNQVTANFTQEGVARLIQMPFHFKEVVERLISDSGAYYGAIDLLDSPQGVVILELNVAPGIEQLENITGLNVIQQLLTANYFCQIS